MTSPGKQAEEAAQKTALYNQITQYGPTGSLVFDTDPLTGRTISRTTLSPAQQKLLEQQEQTQLLLGKRGTAALKALPKAGQPVLPGGDVFDLPSGTRLGGTNPFRLGAKDMASAGEGARRDVEKAQFQRAMSLLNPELGRREDQLRQRLADQGLPQASRAFTSELGRFEDTSNQAREQAALASVLAGGAEQSRMVADMLGVSGAGFGQALTQRQAIANEQLAQRGLDIQTQLTNRQLPFQETLALLTGQRPAGAGDFFAPGQTQVQPGGPSGPSSLASGLAGAAGGAAALSRLGPWGALAGGVLGGLGGLL